MRSSCPYEGSWQLFGNFRHNAASCCVYTLSPASSISSYPVTVPNASVNVTLPTKRNKSWTHGLNSRLGMCRAHGIVSVQNNARKETPQRHNSAANPSVSPETFLHPVSDVEHLGANLSLSLDREKPRELLIKRVIKRTWGEGSLCLARMSPGFDLQKARHGAHAC